MILILAERLTPRLKYAFDLIFGTILKTDIRLITDEQEFIESPLPKFKYGESPTGENILFFKAVRLLFERGISKQEVTYGSDTSFPRIFLVNEGSMSFDPFAASFYLVTRYEEYLPHLKDRYGRYEAHQSIAYKRSFLERPVVNIWATQIKRILLEKFPHLSFGISTFQYQTTIDIDNAYAYKHKGFPRGLYPYAEPIIKGQFAKVMERAAVQLGWQKDPFDSYDKILGIHSQYQLIPVFFILLGNYAQYDKNHSHKNIAMRKLIRRLHAAGKIGIHPSYATEEHPEMMDIEKKRLEDIISEKVTKSRQHFIKLQFPQTYERLLAAGVEEDYSMGYPEEVGYRAGIATPFRFYHLGKEEVTSLKIFPFVAMDVTLKKYLFVRSKDVPDFISPGIEESKSLGGYYSTIFHNESIGGKGLWKNWGGVYENMIRKIIE